MSDENLDYEIELYEDLLRDKPDFIAAIIPLADAYTKKGMYEKGLEMDLRLVRLRPTDDIAHYNLACDYSLLKDADYCLAALRKAVALGYDDFDHMAKDPDLIFIRRDPRFAELVAHAGKKQ